MADPIDLSPIAGELAAHPFRAARWLRNGHAQTAWSPLFRADNYRPSEREILATPDGDRLHLHHYRGEAGRPTALLLHGLEGDHRANYIQGVVAGLLTIGWSATVMEFRGCSGEINLAPRLYHLGETSDLDFVLEELLSREGIERLYLMGVSLGGNVVAKWLGEQGAAVDDRIIAAATVSPPFDLLVSGSQIDRSLGGYYSRRFLRTLIMKAEAKHEQYLGCIPIDRVRSSRTFLEFDTYATAALHGYEDAVDYWTKVSCGRFLPKVRRPLMLLASADDPFNPGSTLPHTTVEESPYLLPQFTLRGGHVGFVMGSVWKPRHWAEEQVVRFFGAIDRQMT